MLKKLFGFTKNKRPPPVPDYLSPAVREAIFNVVGQRSIPPMSGAAQKAFQLSTDPNAEARDFVEVIESDEALSARVIKIANSVFFDRGRPSKTIEESVLVIGINELRSLLSSTSLSDIFPSNNRLRSSLWAHDIASAIISKILAGRIAPQIADLAFLCGLMHDIGKLLLVQRAGDEYEKIIEKIEESGDDFCRVEEQSFVFTHTEVGQLIAEKWNFSDELKEVIKFHHRDWSEIRAHTEHSQLISIVKAASCFAHTLGLGHPRNFTRFRNNNIILSADGFAELGIPESERAGLLTAFQRTFESEYDLYSGTGA